MLEEAGMSAKYCEYAAEHVFYVKKLLPHSALNCSPYEELTKQKPKLKHIKVFGCSGFVYNTKPKSKVYSRANPGIYLGSNDHGVHTVEPLTSGKIVNSVNVAFDEFDLP